MKKLLLLASIVSFLSVNAEITTTILQGQQAEEKAQNAEKVRMKSISNIPNFVKFKKGYELSHNKMESWLQQYYQNDANYGLTLIDEEVGLLGLTHYRYQQTIDGIPVELSMFLAHVNKGQIQAMNGELFSNSNIATQASMPVASAFQKALNHVGATLYKWEITQEEEHLKWRENDVNATYLPKGELVFINNHGLVENELVLAYKFNIYAQEPFGRTEVFVDANTGTIVWEKNLIHDVDVTGTATTLYSGVKTITSDNTGGSNHRLQETGRGNGVRTFTNNNTTNYTNTDVTNTSNNWTVPSAAIDAHWGAEMTYDYFFNEHGRNSIDGNGFRLDSYVSHDNNYANAFWDGSVMTYGDGSGNSTPFTALDIAGHEVTHGLTSNTAGLIYNAESGALNESFSDIFGISIDFINRPTIADWELGDDLGLLIRDMEDPHSKGDPHTYFGTNWASLTGGDNGGVHTNSGVQNFWFVLLVDGGAGTNDNNDSYSINSIGIQKAGQVAFRNLTVYLTSSSDYADARFFAIESAVDLFGSCTNEVEQVTNAWYAVGVGVPYTSVVTSSFDAPKLTSCVVPFSVSFNNTSVNGVNYTWNFGDGDTSTSYSPSHDYTTNGTFAVQLIVDGGLCGTDTELKTAYITVATPAAPITTDDNVCENDVANLSASGTGTLNWYTSLLAGSPVYTGTNYTTVPLSNTTTYYVENVVVGSSGNLGKTTNTGGGGNYNSFQTQFFDVFQAMELVSVVVYADVAGMRIIELKDNLGTTLNTKFVNIPSGQQTVTLNWQINPGVDYEIGLAANTPNVDLYRNNAGLNYPYTLAGIASITKSSANTNPTGYYYFFYDWEVKEQDCISAKEPVTATVVTCTGLDELKNSSYLSAFYNSSNNLELELLSVDKGTYDLTVLNALGQVVLTDKIVVDADKQTELVYVSNMAKGMYVVNLSGNNNNYSVKLVK